MKFNDDPTIQDAWWDELERYEYDDYDFFTAKCAELADELDLFRVQALTDPDFQQSIDEWDEYILSKMLWLALEQCCHEGVLMPMGQRELRVKSCPEELLVSLRYFFGNCPNHIKHHLALRYWVVMRMERARRTGSPEWRPETAEPRSPFKDTVFFQPPKLMVRKYTG